MFDDWTYSPVKNSLVEAYEKLKGGAPGRSALEGEFEYYAAASHALAAVGVPLAPPTTFTAVGITVPRHPAIVVHPGFANGINDWRRAFPTPAAVSITPRSSLVITGPGKCTIEGLALDGGLSIHVGKGASVLVKRLKVENEGVEFVPLEAGVNLSIPDWQKIRAFTCLKKQCRALSFPDPGEYVVQE